MKRLVPLAIVPCLICVSSPSDAKRDPAELSNAVCLKCHADPDVVDDAFLVKEAAFQRGPHQSDNDVTCASCHSKAVEVEDLEDHGDLGKAQCDGCHDVAEELAKSTHAWKPTSGKKQPECRDCHGSAHQILFVSDPDSPAHHDNQIETCGSCHQGKTISMFRRDVHATLPPKKRKKAATCANCHGAHNTLPADLLHDPQFKQELARRCGECHEKEWTIYRESSHGAALFDYHRGGSASCADCHGSHGILAPTDWESKTNAAHVNETCASCHADARLIRRFNLKSDAVSTYRESFHGRAQRLSDQSQAANCASCHDYHGVFPVSDPRSTVHPTNLQKSCGKCHPGASENFLAGSLHVKDTYEDNRWAQLVRAIYLWIIGLTCLGMVIHNWLDFRRKIFLRRERIAALPHVTRMTREQRILHVFFFTSFIALSYTGFALIFPDAWWVAPVRVFSEAESFRSLLHRVCAVVMVIASLYHLATTIFTRRGRAELVEFTPRLRDFDHLRQNVLFFIGRRTERPHFGRFGYVEKVEYWALVWGTGVMVVTGFILWFKTASLSIMPLWLYNVFGVVHRYEAILAVLAIVIWHFYHVMVNPDEAPLSTVWIDGQIPVEELKERHPAEYERLVACGEIAPEENPGSEEP